MSSIALALDYYLDLIQVLIHSLVDWYATSCHYTNPFARREV